MYPWAKNSKTDAEETQARTVIEAKSKYTSKKAEKKAVVLNYPMPRILMNGCFYALEANFMLVYHRTSWKGKNSSRNGGKRGKGLIKHLALGIHLEIS